MLKIGKGDKVAYKGELYMIFKLKNDLVNVVLTNIERGDQVIAPIAELTSIENRNDEESEIRPLDSFNETELQKARVKYNIIKPLLDEFKGNKQKVIEIAKTNEIGVSTIYKWISHFEFTGNIGSLVEKDGRGGKGKIKISSDVNEIIKDCINRFYLNNKSIKRTIIEIDILCKEKGLTVPHENTVRSRIAGVDNYKKTHKRKGKAAADQKYLPAVGTFPGADYPLAFVQIDHTLLDVMLVDEVYRKVLGRPWLTLLIDVFSRVPVGFYLSMDTPGTYGTGRAIVHAMMGKEKFLANLELNSEWPCWGKMINLHCDNAKEFRGKLFNYLFASFFIEAMISFAYISALLFL